MRDHRHHKDQLLTLYVGESAAHYPSLSSPEYTHMFNYSMSLHRNSTWPFTGIQIPRLRAVLAKTGPMAPVSFAEKKKRPTIASWMSNCGLVANKRSEYLRAVLESSNGTLTHAGYGSCLHSAEPWIGRDECLRTCPGWTANKTNAWNNRQKIFISAHHLFTWAAENADCDYYHTEKVFQTLASGSVPIYIGGKTIREVVPTNSVIVAREFAGPNELAAHLMRVAANETLYNEYQEWRKNSIETRLLKLGRDNVDPEIAAERHCDMCRHVHMRIPGRVPPDKSCLRPMWG